MRLDHHKHPDALHKPCFVCEWGVLVPRMTSIDLTYLDGNKSTDKEWFLLRNEPNVAIRTLDELIGLDKNLREAFISVRLEPLKGYALKTYQSAIMKLRNLLQEDKVFLRESSN